MLAQLANVSLSFPDKKVIEDVSLTVYPGDRISLVGENGAGKTSIFRMLKGHLAPDSGGVSFARGFESGIWSRTSRACLRTQNVPVWRRHWSLSGP